MTGYQFNQCLRDPPQLPAVLTLLHLSLYRHGVGLTGDEDLFSYRLTSSLDDSWVNALTLSSFTPVQPVALAVFTWPSSMHQCLAIDLTGGRLAVQPVLILVQFSTLLSSFFDNLSINCEQIKSKQERCTTSLRSNFLDNLSAIDRGRSDAPSTLIYLRNLTRNLPAND